MIPILFESTATSFSTNGIGRLSDAISCIVTEERNGPYELEMQYPITGQYFSELQHSRIIYSVPADGKAAQPFRIYRIEKPLNGICTIYAEHISYELAHIPVKPFTASTCVTALQGLVTNAGQTCPFTVWTNKSVTAPYTLREPKTFRELLGGTQGSILDVYGKGEYEFDGYTVKLYVNRGTDSGVVIRYAKNLVDLVNDENIEEIYTGVCPYWASEDGTVVMLPEVAIWASTAANYPYKRTKIVDFSGEFEEQPTVAQLRARTQQFVEENNIGIPKVNIDVSFVPLWQMDGASLGSPKAELVIPGAHVEGDTLVDVAGHVEGDTVYLDNAYIKVSFDDYKILERIHLCDTVTVVYDALGVDYKAEVIKTVYDVLRGRYESIEVGEPKTTLASIVTGIDEDIDRVEAEVAGDDITQRLMEYVDHQTELITGGLGGYVVLNPNADGEPQEILIMDNADMQSAVNVIRMNKNGIGFSTTGYSGPYTSAWTIDGTFNASFIGAGQITTTHLAASAVTTSKIAAGAITTNKIASGAITAGNISLYGSMGVFTDSGLQTNGGYLGYMTGSADGVSTTGIGLMNTAQDNYLIVTSAGIRATNTSGSNSTEMWLANGLVRFTGTDFRVNSEVHLNYNGSTYSGITYANEIRTQASNAISLKNDTAIAAYTSDSSSRFWMLYSDSSNNTYLGNTSNGTIIRGSSISCANALSVSGNIVRTYSGKNIATLSVATNAGYLLLQDTSGNNVAQLYKSTNNVGVLALYDATGGVHYLTPSKIDQI